MAFPWLTALKIIPWSDVIEHAPKVVASARQLVDRQRRNPPENAAPPAATHPAAPSDEATALRHQLASARDDIQRLQQTQEQLTQTVADLAEQHTRLVEAVDLLRRRTRLLLAVAALLVLGLVWLAAR